VCILRSLPGAGGINHYRINPPIFAGTIGIRDEDVPLGYETALASVGVGVYQDCRFGARDFPSTGLLQLTQFGFREIRTNQDDVADSISITATVGEILFNGTNETRPSEIFFVESLYELSSTVPNQRHTRCCWPVLAYLVL
jgi:hypothetical protein